MTTVRRGVILPVVLLVLLLIGLLVAMFSFRVNADVAATRSVAYRLQTRLAAEAGVERVKLLLRDARYDMDLWYHNPEELHRILVWINDGDETIWGTNDEFDDDAMAYRFSIVTDDPADDEDSVRFGLTDEASKLNLNTATEAQLLILVRAALEGNNEVDPQQIVDAILDWRDADRVPRGEAGDTEDEHYRRLPKPYRVRNGPFDTVEELLLVKGVTGQILYGEDFDRNGLLTPNEDDGDKSFPPDNEDGVLNRGLYPYLTVLSRENNVNNENRPRVYLFGEEATIRAELSMVFPDRPEVVDFIAVAVRSQEGREGGPGGRGNESGELTRRGPGSRDSTDRGEADGRRGVGNDGEEPNGGSEEVEGADEDMGEAGRDVADENAERETDDTTAPGVEDEEEQDDADGRGPTILTPASLLRNRTVPGRQIRFNNPLILEDLPVLMDRTTTVPPEQRQIPGLINVNTSHRLVLKCIEGLTDEQIEMILEARERLDPETKKTTAWLLTEEVVDLDTFEQIAPFITARSQQFTIESLGYADHIGMVTRLQVVVDMVGPIVQTIYYRDLTYLNGHYPIREEDLERLRIR